MLPASTESRKWKPGWQRELHVNLTFETNIWTITISLAERLKWLGYRTICIVSYCCGTCCLETSQNIHKPPNKLLGCLLGWIYIYAWICKKQNLYFAQLFTSLKWEKSWPSWVKSLNKLKLIFPISVKLHNLSILTITFSKSASTILLSTVFWFFKK